MDPVNILRDNKVLKTYCSHFLEADGEDKKHNWEEMTVATLHFSTDSNQLLIFTSHSVVVLVTVDGSKNATTLNALLTTGWHQGSVVRRCIPIFSKKVRFTETKL